MLSFGPGLIVIAAAASFGELQSVVAEILGIVIAIAALLLALAISTGFLEAEAGYALGAPTLLSAVWFKVGAVIICLVIALTAIPISNWLIGILF